MTTLLWLRRDLRRADHPALAAAAADSPVIPVFVVDPAFFDPAPPLRRAWLAATLNALSESYDHRLCLRFGEAATVIPALAAEVGAGSVHVSTETEPAGAARDRKVRQALAEIGVGWQETGSPYAVTPGRIRNQAGGGFAVFTAFHRAWLAHGWRAPAVEPERLSLGTAPDDPAAIGRLESALERAGSTLPAAGEHAARVRWTAFRDGPLADYDTGRDRPDLEGTSQLSGYLKFGVLHPRTLLAEIAGMPGGGASRFVAELAWREFYADVLARHPHSLTEDLHPLRLAYDEPGESFDAWRDGRTGYPIVDAGMRQLAATGWMPNRVRMITASFLTKDLHLWWRHGAAHFDATLLDADAASNAHGWQWVAGTGTDAAPYFRIFNPTTQAERFDPDGNYVRTWLPELAGLPATSVHRPWTRPDGERPGYPDPVIDHAAERTEALRRYQAARAAQPEK